MVMFPVLDETQRLQYLQAIGVASWLPTQPLVGSELNHSYWREDQSQGDYQSSIPVKTVQLSATSPALSVPKMAPASASVLDITQTQQQQSDTDLTGEATATISALSALTQGATNHHANDSMLLKSSNESSAEVNSSVNDRVPVPLTRAHRLAPLHLGLSWYANGVLVVNDIPVQEGAAMSSPIQRLQTAIVNAIRPALSDANVQIMPAASMEFNWPLVPGPHADHSIVGAQSGLKYSLIKLLKDNPCSKLLVMGPAAINLLKPEMALGESGNIELSGNLVQAVYSHSLHQLLAVPSLKKETWSHLMPLFDKLELT